MIDAHGTKSLSQCSPGRRPRRLAAVHIVAGGEVPGGRLKTRARLPAPICATSPRGSARSGLLAGAAASHGAGRQGDRVRTLQARRRLHRRRRRRRQPPVRRRCGSATPNSGTATRARWRRRRTRSGSAREHDADARQQPAARVCAFVGRSLNRLHFWCITHRLHVLHGATHAPLRRGRSRINTLQLAALSPPLLGAAGPSADDRPAEEDEERRRMRCRISLRLTRDGEVVQPARDLIESEAPLEDREVVARVLRRRRLTNESASSPHGAPRALAERRAARSARRRSIRTARARTCRRSRASARQKSIPNSAHSVASGSAVSAATSARNGRRPRARTSRGTTGERVPDMPGSAISTRTRSYTRRGLDGPSPRRPLLSRWRIACSPVSTESTHDAELLRKALRVRRGDRARLDVEDARGEAPSARRAAAERRRRGRIPGEGCAGIHFFGGGGGARASRRLRRMSCIPASSSRSIGTSALVHAIIAVRGSGSTPSCRSPSRAATTRSSTTRGRAR